MLHSNASMIVLQFCRNHFIDVYRHMLIAAIEIVTQLEGNGSKSSVRTSLPRKQRGQWYMVKHLRRPAIAVPVS